MQLIKKLFLISFLCLFSSSCDLPDAKIEGEVCLTKQDGSAHKQGFVPVKIFRKEQIDGQTELGAWDQMDIWTNQDSQLTDSEGKFSFNVPKDDYLLVVAALKKESDKTETIYWYIPVSADQEKVTVLLSDQNASYKTTYQIE